MWIRTGPLPLPATPKILPSGGREGERAGAEPIKREELTCTDGEDGSG